MSKGPHREFRYNSVQKDYEWDKDDPSQNFFQSKTRSYKKCEGEYSTMLRDTDGTGRYVKVPSVICPQYDYEYPYRFGVNVHWYRDFATKKNTN